VRRPNARWDIALDFVLSRRGQHSVAFHAAGEGLDLMLQTESPDYFTQLLAWALRAHEVALLYFFTLQQSGVAREHASGVRFCDRRNLGVIRRLLAPHVEPEHPQVGRQSPEVAVGRKYRIR